MYRCGNGHVLDTCITRHSLSYEDIAARIMENVDFLLKLAPAAMVEHSTLSRSSSSRLRLLLRRSSIDTFEKKTGVSETRRRRKEKESRQRAKSLRQSLLSFAT